MPRLNKHIVAMLAPAWGHTISYIHFMNQLLRMDEGLVITIVQHNLLVPKMISELAGTSYDTQRVRIIGVGSKESSGALKAETIFVAMQELANDWLATLPSLFCEVDEKWPKPNSIYLDFACGGSVIEQTKAIAGPSCKTLLWWTAPVVSILSHLSDNDFLAIAEGIYADGSKRNGRSLDEILHQVRILIFPSPYHLNPTAAIQMKSLLCFSLQTVPTNYPAAYSAFAEGPDIYDHERQAYGAGAPFGAQMFTAAQKLAKHVDGTENDRVVTLFNERVKNFLDGAAGKYGARSVLYISFGSLFFPVATPHLVEALVDTLLTLDQPFPFIFALGGQMASLPPSLVDRVHKSGKGLICDFWVEQRAILQHGAVGWFLTHGGANSLSESLTQGIPLIIWPVAAEQPLNAALFSAEPNPVAIELFQIRTGPHIGPSLHTEASITGTIEDATKEFKATFDVARGPRGQMLQNNAAKLAESLRQERENEIPKELERLINF
ncbi:hypothetical protein R3P38DRAFT_3348674 [Favolaschia claudopus]|uniref:Glycosyltransferase n=1 Tax=Favolaschia claudopus TaxID=2862362 RepID=A0AAW0CSK3_9AGAR